MKLKFITILLTLIFTYNLTALAPFTIETQREYQLLLHLFKTACTEEEYGYVLEGTKPISIRNYYDPAQVPFSVNYLRVEKEVAQSLLIAESLPILKKLNQYSKQFVLKATPMNVLGSNHLELEVQFINVPLLEKTIEENISLFRYILGPTTTSKEVTHRLAFSEETFSDILLENHTLIGIVLGYGTQNSVIGGRAESINFLSFSPDVAPHPAKGANIGYGYAHHFFNAHGSIDSPISFRMESRHLTPMPGFITIKDEIEAIHELKEPIPDCLYESPVFQFGAYKTDPSNGKLFDRLRRSQKTIKNLSSQTNFLENILTKILGKKPIIKCAKTHQDSLNLSFFKGSIGVDGWKNILSEVSHQFRESKRNDFFETFFNPPAEVIAPKFISYSEATLIGLQSALANLAETKKFFENFSRDASLLTIVPHQLYYKTVIAGSGKSLDEFDCVRLNYCITDLNGRILSANHDEWLCRSQLVPGFAHGLQEMTVGEKREIYIHPSLGYGVLTTMPPCMGLIATVQLLDVDEKYVRVLPPLSAIDCDWVEDPKLLEEMEQNIAQKAPFVGWFCRNLMKKIEEEQAEKIIHSLLELGNF